MKVRLQPGLLEVSGCMGEWVYTNRNGKTVLGMKPHRKNGPSEAELNQRARFRKAAVYGRLAMADSSLHQFYLERSMQTGKPIFALMIADFMKPPSIQAWDISAYQGQVGDVIKLTTDDDGGVVDVTIEISDSQGALIEKGKALEELAGTGAWQYNAKASVPAGTTVSIKAVATDRPGGTAVSTNSKTL